MKHVTYAAKSLLVGDEMADVLLEYAAQLSSDGDGKALNVRAISGDGDEVVATFLLSGGVPLMAETTTSTLPEPDNVELVGRIRAEISRRRSPQETEPHDEPASVDDELMGWGAYAHM
jgi:hypothetical protein